MKGQQHISSKWLCQLIRDWEVEPQQMANTTNPIQELQHQQNTIAAQLQTEEPRSAHHNIAHAKV